MAINEVPERRPSFVISVGTRMLYSVHRIAGLGVEKLMLGGMTPVSKMEQTFEREARNAVISK
jgi:hypothetical protein